MISSSVNTLNDSDDRPSSGAIWPGDTRAYYIYNIKIKFKYCVNSPYQILV